MPMIALRTVRNPPIEPMKWYCLNLEYILYLLSTAVSATSRSVFMIFCSLMDHLSGDLSPEKLCDE